MELAISIALIFELLWLDLIPAGTFIPPNAAAATLGSLMVASVFDFSQPSELVFPILFCLPLAWIGSRVEQVLRGYQNRAYNRLQHWLRPGKQQLYAPEQLIHSAFVQAFAVQCVFFLFAGSLLVGGIEFLLRQGFLMPPPVMFSWGLLWVSASVGGVLALRLPRAYAVMCSAVLVVALSTFV